MNFKKILKSNLLYAIISVAQTDGLPSFKTKKRKSFIKNSRSIIWEKIKLVSHKLKEPEKKMNEMNNMTKMT